MHKFGKIAIAEHTKLFVNTNNVTFAGRDTNCDVQDSLPMYTRHYHFLTL